MDQLKDKNNPGIEPGNIIDGCVVKRIVALPEIRAVFYSLEHTATGAKFVHISNKDEENTFGVAFKTVPADSTGVAHILEHTVLCGSKRFQVRDPFFSMLKRSLNTFMNAFTASDWTMYPFCTQNRKDYFNLMDVYLDAAFFPDIAPLSFKQEGHRLEMAAPANTDGLSRLVYKGVVYNEMKGAMSSPDQVCQRSLLNALYPDTTYRHNSGGDPAVIPSLTHEQLVAFHRVHYHPSNAFFYTYGNIPLKDSLAFISERVLDQFERIDPGTTVPPQPRWAAPKEATYYYPLGGNEDPTKKYQACLAWLTADIQDSFEVLVLSLLEDILLGNSAAPLRKALIDSGLGSALSDGTGFDPDNRDTMFACGLKDVAADAAPAVEKIIHDTLHALVDEGIDPTIIEGAIHQLEFRQKEITNTPYPYGLKLLMRFSGSWFHGGDPVRHLRLDEDLAKLRRDMRAGGLFEGRIKKYFLDNPHRVRFVLSPDQTMAEKENERVAAELEKIQAGLSKDGLDRIEQDARALAKRQESEENISCLPTLERADIPPVMHSVKQSPPYARLAGSCYAQPTSGILYFSALAGIGSVPGKLLSWLPFFCYAYTKLGTARHDYTQMARRMELYTGGVGLGANVRTQYDPAGTCMPYVILDGKCLERNVDNMFEILTEYIKEVVFSDPRRLKQLLMEFRAGLESMVIHNGHRLAMSLASRRFTQQTALSESWNGVQQLRFIKNFADNLPDDAFEALSKDLATIGGSLFAASNVRTCWIGDGETLNRSASAGAAMAACLGDDGRGSNQWPRYQLPTMAPDGEIPREGWCTATSVSFVARTFQTVRMGHPDAPALAVIAKLLRSLYLHREIREKGGAYGGFAVYSSENGLFGFASYRDPHIVSTLNAFTGASDFIRAGEFTDEDVKEALLQVCSELDKPDPPGPSAKKAFMREFVSLTDEIREKHKKQLLALDREQVVAVARKYFDPGRTGQAVAVISGEDKLNAANEQMGDDPLALNVI